MITTVIIFIAILAVLVLVHEFGHFIAAKKSGMKVEEFGFGFPPRLFGVQKQEGKFRLVLGHPKELSTDNTVYSFNLIPLGGFVKILGENNDAASTPNSFTSKSFGRRLITLLAGVVMNVLLAWVLISIGYMYGLPVGVDSSVKFPSYVRVVDSYTSILDIDPNSPASKAGLRANDTIQSLDGQSFKDTEQVQRYIREHKGKQFSFVVKRSGKSETILVDSLANPEVGQGSVGVSMLTVARVQYPFVYAISEGARTTVFQVYAIFHGLYELIIRGVGLGSVGGPVKIAQMTGEVASLGAVYLLQFTAFLSLNLAVLNSLPFPALDGGRVLFLLIEKIRGKHNNQRFEMYANTLGFAILLLLMLVVTIKDVKSFW